MSQPFFSVIIATYNRAQLLPKALDSLISQTTDDWEAIIVDDGSSDNTYSHILSYLKLYSNIKYLGKEHSGCAMSKNAGISLSNGKYITFLDSDDEYDKKHLESRKKILMGDPSIRFLYGGANIIGNQYVPDRFDYNKSVSLNDCVIGGTFCIERETIFILKGFRKIMLGEDADLFERAKSLGILTKETKLPTYIYHHETVDSITNKLHFDSSPKRKSHIISVG